MNRSFDLGDVLSITTGRPVSPRHMAGIYDILNFMTGESLFTHQLPRVIREAAPILLAQHPALAEIAEPDFKSPDEVAPWLAAMKARYGETLEIAPMGADQHERIDPLSELAEMVHPDRIVVVNPEQAA